MKRSSLRSLVLLVVVGLLAGVGGGATWAAFSATTTNSGSTFSSVGDGTPPSASASVIQKSQGGIVGFIRQGGQYRVYANVTDAGSPPYPPSGVATVTANVSSISTGQTAAALTAGSWTVGGVSYNYGSGLLTANNPLAAGSYAYTLTMTDNNSNSQTQGGFSVTVDNTAPAGADIQAANGGATVGKAETNDTITYTFTKAIDPESILAGWNGSGTAVTLRLVDSGNSDLVQVWNASNTSQLPLGQVDLGRDYVAANVNFTNSTMVRSGVNITVTLGTPSGATLTVTPPPRSMTWTPSASAYGSAGNPVSTAVVSELPPGDVEF